MYLYPAAPSRGLPLRRRRPFLGLGQGTTSPYCVSFSDDGVTPESLDFETTQAECVSHGGKYIGPFPNTPVTVNAPVNLNPPVSGGHVASFQSSSPGSLFGAGALGYVGLGLGVIGLLAILRGRRR